MICLSTKDALLLFWVNCNWYVCFAFQAALCVGPVFVFFFLLCCFCSLCVEDCFNARLSTQVKYGNEDQHVDSLNAASLSSDQLLPNSSAASQPQCSHIMDNWAPLWQEIATKLLKPRGLKSFQVIGWQPLLSVSCPHSAQAALCPWR